MAKAILEYDLADLDDSREHLRAIKSTDMALILWELNYNTKRNIERLIDSGAIKEPQSAIDRVFEEIRDLMNQYGIIIEDLVV